MTKNRVFLVVIDSVGAGGAHDASDYGDEGSNTLAHIAEFLRTTTQIHLPNMASLGLRSAVKTASGIDVHEFGSDAPIGFSGAAVEHSQGKDTPSGHWEIAGVPVPWAWHYFPNQTPSFPPELIAELEAVAGVKFIGLCHASGTAIIDELGEEHLRTGNPIAYTSVDSVFQIAAHEEAFGLERLYDLCEACAKILHPMKVGRVIARPFVGKAGAFKRTVNRHDYAIDPPEATILDRAQESGRPTVSIGKISDIFSGHGIDRSRAGMADAGLFDAFEEEIETAADGTLLFANFVEFDSLFGHPRDPLGYGRALEWFDKRLGDILPKLRENDLLMITADHGNDPTWSGNDHTRERVPVLCYSPAIDVHDIGLVDFADIGASALDHLDVETGLHGKSFLPNKK